MAQERAAAGVTPGCSRPLDWDACNSWKNGPSNDDGDVDLSRWIEGHNVHGMYEGAGHETTVKQALPEKWAERACTTRSLTSGGRRAKRRKR